MENKKESEIKKEIERKSKEEKPLNINYRKQGGHGRSIQCKIGRWKAEEKMKNKWKGLMQYVAITRTGYRDKKWFEKTTFYITNTNLSSYRLSNIIRGHRKIENALHWTKDVMMKEDECGIRSGC